MCREVRVLSDSEKHDQARIRVRKIASPPIPLSSVLLLLPYLTSITPLGRRDHPQ